MVSAGSRLKCNGHDIMDPEEACILPTSHKPSRFNLLLQKSFAKLIWETVVAVSVILSIFLVTFQAVFHASLVWQWVLIYVLDALYVVSIVLRFVTGYKKRGVLVVERRKIALHYLKTYFIPDLLSVLPLEIFAFASADAILVAAFLRLNRCIRCYRVWTFLTGEEKKLGTNTILLMSLRFTYLGWLSIHIMACIWYALPCSNAANSLLSADLCRSGTWTDLPDIVWNRASDFEKYVVAFYWAVTTITSVGYGDIVPMTAAEKWVATLCMVWGVVLFGYILGGLASLLTNADAQRARYIHRLNTIRYHLTEVGISDELKKKVIGYYEYLWQRNKGKVVTDLFEELPLTFQAELSLETYRTMIEQSSLFQDASEEFMRMLSLVVKHTLYLPSQIIINKGDIGRHMYFIRKGEVEVLPDEDSAPSAVLKEGDLFGEVNLVYNVPCTGVVRAKTHCDILQLSKSDTSHVLHHFPDIANKMKEGIKHRCDTAFNKTVSGSCDLDQQFSSAIRLEEESGTHISMIKDTRTRKSDIQRSPGRVQSIIQSLKLWWIKHPVLPKSKFAIFWDFLVMLVIVVICWVFSYQAGFAHFKPSVSYGANAIGQVMFGFTYLLDLVLLLDVIVSMKKAVVTSTGVITDARTICLHYVKSPWFILDIIAVLPLELAVLAWVESGEHWDYIALFRINRIAKVWKLIAFFNELEGSLYISAAHARALKFTFYILTTTHISACIWFPLACFTEGSCLDSSWAAAHSISANTSGLHDYLTSLYWASATMTSVGYGDISAHNIQEMILALVIQLIGIMLYGYCLGVIATTLTNVESPRISFQEKMQAVHQFMFDHNLGKGLLERVDHYFTLLWGQFQGEAIPGAQPLMHDMPQTVQEDVSMEAWSSMVNNIPFFNHTDLSFLRRVSLTTSTYMFAPGDIVLYTGDMGREMYCVRKGYVEALTEDLSQVVTVIGPGGYFGELGFLFGCPRTSTVRAATHCELVMLNRADLDRTLESYPLIARQFEEITSDSEHLKAAQKAVFECSTKAMNNPRRFAKPCILTALATIMATPLSVVVRAPLANTIAACVGGKDAQSKVSCPISIGEPVTGSVVKFSRKEMSDMMRADRDWSGEARPQEGIRKRRVRSRAAVAPAEVGISEDEEERPHSLNMARRIEAAVEKIFSYCLIPYTFIPTTRMGEIWEVVASLLAFLTAITVAIQASFLHEQPVLWTVNYLMDIFFAVDMVLKLHTAYYNSKGVLITQPLACAKHYFKTGFFIDMLSSFPTDLIVLASWPRDIGDVLRVLSLARLNRLLKIYKLPLAFNYLESQVARSTGLIREIKFAMYMALGTHWTACGWFLIACSSLSIGAMDPHTCNVGSWALKFSDVPLTNFSIAYQFVVSLYWSTATTTTVGYGDIRAHTDLERVYASFVMVLGVLAYGYIVASVAASLANADSARAQYQEKLKAVKSYMADQKLDSSVTKRVTNYYEYIWQRNKGVNFGSLFQGMPISLQADISLSLYKKIIDQVPLFQNTEIGFTKLLALSIKPVLFLNKEYIVRKGDIGSEMFFINRGRVEVVSEDGSVVFATMDDGKFFGEISLVFSCPRTASIRAGTNCDLFVLTKTDLDRALSYYPHIAEQIREVAGNRANLVKKRSQIAAKAAAEGKSASDAAKAAAQGTQGEEGEESKPSSSQQKDADPETVDATSAGYEEPSSSRARVPTCFTTCWMKFLQRVWPTLRWCLTFTIPNKGIFGTVFQLLGCLLAYLSAITISYQAAFQNNSPVLWGTNYIFEAYFLAELFIKFHLAYEDSQGQLETNFKSIALHYLKTPTGFVLDFIGLFPCELIALPIPDPATRTAALLYLRLPHVIRVIRIQGFFSVEEKRLNQRTLLLRLLKFIVLISLCTHFVACIWYILGCQAGICHSSTWANSAELLDPYVSDADRYCSSLYWAVATMTTTGYGDLSATNVQEMLYAIGVMVVGKLLFGFILGSIASTFANLDSQRVFFEEKLSALKDYMKEQQLPSALKHRVLDFFEYLWVRNKGTDRQSLLSDLPYCMQAEVSLATTESLLRKVPIFASADSAFLRHLTLMIKPCLFLPKEYIVHKGDVGLGMFFLYHGTVEVMDGDNPKEVLTEGGYFGQKSLIYDTPMESSVRAVTHVDMFTLSQIDFEHVLQDHPTVRNMMSQAAEEQYGTPMDHKS